MTLLDERIEKANTICILGHQNPDGDCIGATLAIYNYIENKYEGKKKVKPYLTEFSENFLILKNADKISQDMSDAEKYDLCIVVDCGSTDRFKDFSRYFEEAKDTIVFDHHENNTLPAKVSVVDPTSIATCEILYSFLSKEYIDSKVAECLYTGIATDSGVFRYKDTKRKTLEIAGALLDYGFDQSYLLDTIVFNNTVNQRKAQAVAFDRLKLICKGQVSFSYILDEEIDALNLKKTDIDNIIVYIREIKNIRAACFVYPTGHNIWKLSLRSNEDTVDVSEFARLHEGGGHKRAAGCIYHGTIEQVSEYFAKDMAEFLNDK